MVPVGSEGTVMSEIMIGTVGQWSQDPLYPGINIFHDTHHLLEYIGIINIVL